MKYKNNRCIGCLKERRLFPIIVLKIATDDGIGIRLSGPSAGDMEMFPELVKRT